LSLLSMRFCLIVLMTRTPWPSSSQNDTNDDRARVTGLSETERSSIKPIGGVTK
jgi:hypothetical protein